MNKVYLLLGSNIGDRKKNLEQAGLRIQKKIGKIISLSSIYETAAWGNTNQNNFYNQSVCVETGYGAEEVLQKILDIEKEMGRERRDKWEARIIDIDILIYNMQIVETENLKIPHPYLHERKFSLIPLGEINPDLFHPKLQKTVSQLLLECKDTLAVKKI